MNRSEAKEKHIVRNPWFAQGEPQDRPGVRLFCLPHAGGSAAVYREWRDLAPDPVQVHPLEIPGRGGRWGEPPVTDLVFLAGLLADALAEYLDRPYALFGHSMGGLLAFELARTLRGRGLPRPEHLFVSGAQAPELPRTRRPIHAAPEADVIDELRRLGGTPAGILDDAGLMELFLPTLRADYAMLETYHYRDRPPLAVPMTVLGGDADPVVEKERLHLWRRHTDAPSRLVVLPGDHFFLFPEVADVMAAVAAALVPAAPDPVPGPQRGVA
ncbi:thioesterase II family protein [Streptomyces halstedii]|uniref:thioesterase II family protein n=1 Tax=Streptomyces halstedii TaxID=1944 RepID=UPI002F2657A5